MNVHQVIVAVDSVATRRDHLPGALLATLLLMVIVERVLLVTIVVHGSATSAEVARQALPDPHHRLPVLPLALLELGTIPMFVPLVLLFLVLKVMLLTRVFLPQLVVFLPVLQLHPKRLLEPLVLIPVPRVPFKLDVLPEVAKNVHTTLI